MEKVAELVRRQLCELFQETVPEELGLVTIMDVIVAADLKNAVVYISVTDKDKETRVLELLDGLKPEFQRALGKNMDMRFTPRLNFKIDDSTAEINHVEEILEKIDSGA